VAAAAAAAEDETATAAETARVGARGGERSRGVVDNGAPEAGARRRTVENDGEESIIVLLCGARLGVERERARNERVMCSCFNRDVARQAWRIDQ
jgi:hypothetical protein